MYFVPFPNMLQLHQQTIHEYLRVFFFLVILIFAIIFMSHIEKNIRSYVCYWVFFKSFKKLQKITYANKKVLQIYLIFAKFAIRKNKGVCYTGRV